MLKRLILIFAIVSMSILTIAGISFADTEKNTFTKNEFLITEVKNINLDDIDNDFKRKAIFIGANNNFAFFSKKKEFIRYNIENETLEYINEKHDYSARKIYIIEDSLYVVYLLGDNRLYFDIVKYNFNDEPSLLYSDKTTSMPFFSFSSNNIFLGYSKHEGSANTFEEFKSSFNIFSRNNMKYITGLDFYYMQNIDGKIIGEKIIYSGVSGEINNDEAVIETLKPNNQIIEGSRGNFLYFMKTVEGKIQLEIIKTNDIYLHVNNNRDLLLTLLYNYEKPIENSGRLKRIGKDGLEEEHIIKGIESGKDIRGSKVYEGDILVFENRDFVYFYDLKKWEYQKIKKNIKNTKIYYGDTAVYMCFIEEKNITIKEVRWD